MIEPAEEQWAWWEKRLQDLSNMYCWVMEGTCAPGSECAPIRKPEHKLWKKYINIRELFQDTRFKTLAKTLGNCEYASKKSPTNMKISNCKTLLLLLSRFSRVRLRATPEMAAHQAPPSLGFSRQEHWSALPFPSPMHESESESEVTQSSLTLSDPMDYSPPGSSIHGIFQARVLEWGAIAFSVAKH